MALNSIKNTNSSAINQSLIRQNENQDEINSLDRKNRIAQLSQQPEENSEDPNELIYLTSNRNFKTYGFTGRIKKDESHLGQHLDITS